LEFARCRSQRACAPSFLSALFPRASVLDGSTRVLAWGDNSYGQNNVPADPTQIVAIAAGRSRHMALRFDGTVRSWGASLAGETQMPEGLSNVMLCTI
jgi:hypothetical protein